MIFLQYLPQILFLLLLFWYLCILMILKWFMYSADAEDVSRGTSCAPLVLIIFINMMLLKDPAVTDGDQCDPYMFAGQHQLQRTFLTLAFLCIPVMLMGKPLYQMWVNKKQKQYPNGVESGEVEKEEDGGMSEVLITQAIHTIEFVLGAVSHTASYLRLWALSLAHAQLSAVLWQRVMVIGFRVQHSVAGPIFLFAIFAAWAFFTLAILVLMEGLSAFLHTLRLHWVEFMSKFYEGQGYPFIPFSFSAILENDIEETPVKANGGPPE